jgi:hypothetical protein
LVNLSSAEESEYREKYLKNKDTAYNRGIPWELSFEQWMGLWAERIGERGPYKGQYVLCRKNDLGGYAIGNCYIATKSHNSSVRGYAETRTNCVAYGEYADQRAGLYRRQSFDGGHRPTALGRSIFHANAQLEPRAYDDAVKGLVALFRQRFPGYSVEDAGKLVRQALREYMYPKYYSDHDRARAMKLKYKVAQKFARKISYLLNLIAELDRYEKQAA